MRASKFLFVTILAAISFVFVASGSPKKDIIGKWQETDDKTRLIEFFSDNTIDGKMDKEEVTGTYTFLADGRLKVTLEASGKKSIGVNAIEIKDDVLTLTGEDGKKQTYKRIR